MDRKKLEALVWKHTHKDSKGKLDGVKTVMSHESERRESGVSSLVTLSDLSEAQLLARLPKEVRDKLDLSLGS